MCGIAGFQSARDDEPRLDSLLASLADRGPDGSWGVTRWGFALAQTRLAVVDLSKRVRYPLPNERGDVLLLFNGEIYDHRPMRAELERHGHRFATDCDAEVIVHGFEEWDVDVFQRLDGMFACGLLDGRDGRLVLARDRFGIKPLVHTTGNQRFAFSSDALSLVRAGLSSGTVDPAAVSEFAAFHYVPPPRTGLEDVTELDPGTALVVKPDGSRETRRWAPDLLDGEGARGVVGLEAIDAALEAAVRRQLVADVPVGVLLSSGLDSALILSYAVASGANPSAFTIAFPGAGDYDESAGAAEVAHALGVTHEIQSFRSGFEDAVLDVSAAFDRPFADPSAIATLQLARLARSKVTVALSGTGGDELFAGYYRVRAHRLRKPARVLASLFGSSESGGLKGSERDTRSELFGSYVKRLASGDVEDDVSQYLSIAGSATSSSALSLMSGDTDLRRARRAVGERFGLRAGRLERPSRSLQQFDLKTYLPGDVLAKDDRATMRVGLEARVPLLDPALAALASRMSDDDKASLLVGKKPLRCLAAQRLTGIRAKSAKRGFAVPLAQLFAGPWASESRRWAEAQRSDLVDTSRMAQRMREGTLTAPDTWALSSLVAWEGRLRRERERASALS